MCIHAGAFDLLQWMVESKIQNEFKSLLKRVWKWLWNKIKEKKELENKRVYKVVKIIFDNLSRVLILFLNRRYIWNNIWNSIWFIFEFRFEIRKENEK